MHCITMNTEVCMLLNECTKLFDSKLECRENSTEQLKQDSQDAEVKKTDNP